MQHKAIIYIKIEKCSESNLESNEEEGVSEETFAPA